MALTPVYNQNYVLHSVSEQTPPSNTPKLKAGQPNYTPEAPSSTLSSLIHWVWMKISAVFHKIFPQKNPTPNPLSDAERAAAIDQANPSSYFTKENVAKALAVTLIAGALIYNREQVVSQGSAALNYLYNNPVNPILGLALFNQFKDHAYRYSHTPIIEEKRDGSHSVTWKRDYIQMFKAATFGLAAVGLGVAMYQAVTDGVEDNSLLEQAGNVAADLLHPVVEIAKNFWDHPLYFIPTGLSLRIPFTEYTFWQGHLPLPKAIPLNIACGITNSIAYAILPKFVRYPIVLGTEYALRFAQMLHYKLYIDLGRSGLGRMGMIDVPPSKP